MNMSSRSCIVSNERPNRRSIIKAADESSKGSTAAAAAAPTELPHDTTNLNHQFMFAQRNVTSSVDSKNNQA